MSLTTASRVGKIKPSSTLNIAATVLRLKSEGKDVVSFTVGQPDFNTPENIREAAKRAIDEGFTKYTAVAGCPELLEAVSAKFLRENGLHYSTNQIVTCNGGKHALMNVLFALVEEGDEVIIPGPYWLSYPEMVKLADGTPVFVPADETTDYKVTVEALEKAVTPKTKAMFLNSPSNPTGMLYQKEDLEAIADFAVRHQIYVISDEIYEHLNYTGRPHVSIASLNESIYQQTVTVNGLSKSSAMTGWRMGYIGAPEYIAKAITAIQSHQTSNISSITQKAAIEALNGPQKARDDMGQAFARRRELIIRELKKIEGIRFPEPEGAFYVFINCEDLIGKAFRNKPLRNASDLADILLEDFSVAVIPCPDFGYPNHIRLSYAISDEEIVKGVKRIADMIAEVK